MQKKSTSFRLLYYLLTSLVTLAINSPGMVALIHYVLVCLPEDVQVAVLQVTCRPQVTCSVRAVK